jgi:hypothetical protein
MTDWLELPFADLPASVRVDVLGILAYSKPAIRIPISDPTVTKRVVAVITAIGWSHATDEEYLIASAAPEAAVHILEVDRDVEPHTLKLGLLLGYPACCARAAAHACEENIDRHAAHLGGDCDRERAPHLDPRKYSAGIALVPYVACSPRCPNALQHARAAINHINAATNHAATLAEPWRTWRQAVLTLEARPSTTHHSSP